MFPTDDHQAVALAALARDLGAVRVAALDDGDLLYGRALADRFARAARALGATVVARRRWAPDAAGYAAARRRRGPGAARRRLPRRHPRQRTARPSCAPCGARCRPTTAILLGDGFTPTVFLARQAGAAAEGAYVGVTGLVDASLGARGRAFVAAFGATLPGVEIEPTAVYTAEATGVLLDAIAALGRHARRRARRASSAPGSRTGSPAPCASTRAATSSRRPITVLRVRRGARGPRRLPGHGARPRRARAARRESRHPQLISVERN